MDYITFSQFMEQPEKVQKVLKKYFYGDRNLYPAEITETQLRHFIEEKVGGKIESSYRDNGYEILVYDAVEYAHCLKNMFTNTTDLIEAYWKFASKVAEEC
jgi:hypothetical protein